MKILIVSRSFYPENSPRSLRATELVKEFSRQGHEVTLLTLKNDEFHIPFETEYGVTIKDIGVLKLPRIALKGEKGIGYWVKRILQRVLSYFFEYPDIEFLFKLKKVLRQESGYDLMISLAAPHPVHWGVARARSNDKPIAKVWAADCGDPYFGRENDSFKVLFYFAYLEKFFCRKADFLTIPFEGAKEAYFEEFKSKLRIIPQGLSFPTNLNLDQNSPNDVITFAYFGNISSYLHYAVPFLQKLNSVNFPFKFIIYTRREDILKRNLNRATLKKCSIREYVGRFNLLHQISHVDFLVHFPYQNESQKSLKLIDYNFLQKPILVYRNDKASNSMLEEFLNWNFENKREFEDYSKYKIENVCNQFLALIEHENKISEGLNDNLSNDLRILNQRELLSYKNEK